MEISVVIPVYNKAEYLDRCFDSILAQQNFTSFEIIAVDDGSTDDSGRRCDEWAARESRLRVVHTENSGVTAARRVGVERARGRYIMFADADDQLLPDALQLMYDTIEQNGADEVVGTYVDQYGRHYDSGLRGWTEPELMIRRLLGLKAGFCVLWGIIFRRELLDGCLSAPRAIVEREDSLMQIKCLMKKPRVFFIQQAVYLHEEDVPNNRRESLDWIRIYDEELRQTLQPEWDVYKSAFVGHQLKVYEKFIDRRQFHVFKDYYRPLRKQLSSDIPLADRMAILLPPCLSYYPIHLYKKLKQKKTHS